MQNPTPNQKRMALDVEENPKKISEWILFALQHVLAMLVACITVPLLTGLPVAATIVSAGIGTLIYLFFTKKKSPVFLSSSFAYLSPMFSALGVGAVYNAAGDAVPGYAAVAIGMISVGLVYAIVAIVIKFVGTKWLNKLLPPIVVGPIIMVIGLSLSGSAINNLVGGPVQVSEGVWGSGFNWIAVICGLIAMVTVALCSHYGKKMVALIPFVIGMGAGYVAAALFTVFGYHIGGNNYFHIIDFTKFTDIFAHFEFSSIFNYKMFVPNDGESFIFLRLESWAAFPWDKLGTVLLLFVPVAFVTICEHVGDHENLGNILGRDLLNDEPGMHRTLLGDGIATAASGVLCGAANTTYGENVAVIGTTKIASVNVVFLAALFSIVFGFFTPFTKLLETIPGCVTGGVSLILYGFIASSGVKMLLAEKINFNESRNIFIASVILVAGIGGLTFYFGNPNNPVITITSIAVAMILGILMNFILKEKKNEAPAIEAPAEEPAEEPEQE